MGQCFQCFLLRIFFRLFIIIFIHATLGAMVSGLLSGTFLWSNSFFQINLELAIRGNTVYVSLLFTLRRNQFSLRFFNFFGLFSTFLLFFLRFMMLDQFFWFILFLGPLLFRSFFRCSRRVFIGTMFRIRRKERLLLGGFSIRRRFVLFLPP